MEVFSRKLLDKLSLVDAEQLERLLSVMVEEKQLLSQILESMSDGVLVTDACDRILFVNRAAQIFLGQAPAPLPGNLLQELDSDPALLRAIGQPISPGVSCQIRTQKPRHAWLEVISFPLGESAPTQQGMLHVIRDQTSHRKLLDTNARESRIASLGALAAGLAHEIRNPLNALSIHTQLAQRELASKDIQGCELVHRELEIISDAVIQLESIVRCFLDAARPRRPARRARDIHSILDTSLTLLLPEIEEHGIHLHQRYDRNIPPLLIDAVQFQEVVTNLVRNAVQSMPHGGELAVRTWEDDKGIIRIEFEDTGSGISDDFLSRIFDPYTTTKENGTGLGLFLVHRIVREHLGAMEVESEQGKGTRMSILLPRSLCEARFFPHE